MRNLFEAIWAIHEAVHVALRRVLTRRYVDKVLREMKLPSKKLDYETWCMLGEIKNGRRVVLDIVEMDGQLNCIATAGITIDEPWVLQSFAVAVLKDSSRYQIGANRLFSSSEGLKLIHSHCFDPKRYKPREIARMCRVLIHQMHELMQELRDAELIIPVDPPAR